MNHAVVVHLLGPFVKTARFEAPVVASQAVPGGAQVSLRETQTGPDIGYAIFTPSAVILGGAAVEQYTPLSRPDLR